MTPLLLLALAQVPSYDQLIERAVAARERGELELSLSLFDEAFALSPSPALRHNRARLYEDLGRYGEAAEEYQALIADPSAPEKLREADLERARALAPRLGLGWVRLEAPAAERCFLGRVPCPPPGEERGLPPGRVRLERLRGRALFVEELELTAGRRRVITPLSDRPGGGLALTGLPPTRAVLELEAAALSVPAGELDQVLLDPCFCLVHVADGSGAALFRGRVQVPREGRLTLPFRAPAPAPARAERSLSAWPVVLGAAGVLAATLGPLYFFGQAERDRDRVRQAPVDEEGRIRGVTRQQALELERSAETSELLGALSLGAGAVTALSALAYLLLSGAEPAADAPPAL